MSNETHRPRAPSLLVRLLALGLAAGCRSGPPESSESLRESFRTAHEVHVVVHRAAGGSYPPLVIAEPLAIEAMADLLRFTGEPARRGSGVLATTVSADLVLFRDSGEREELGLRANRLWFGDELEYELELVSDGLYRHLRERVGDPVR
jgi:hypothetical protein